MKAFETHVNRLRAMHMQILQLVPHSALDSRHLLRLFQVLVNESARFHAATVTASISALSTIAKHTIDKSESDRLLASCRDMLTAAKADLENHVVTSVTEICNESEIPNPWGSMTNEQTRDEILKSMEGDHTEGDT